MKPLSRLHRLLYLGVLIALFFAVFPIVLFYADGYRYDSKLGLFKTGGIFISVPYSGAVVYLNGILVGQSSFLTRSFYIDDLAPGIYTVRVSRPESREWERALIVETQVVTDASALLLPETFTMLELVTSTASTTATSTRVVSADEYRDHEITFVRPAATTTVFSSNSDVVVEDGNVLIRWTNPERLPDSIFCRRPSFCTSDIVIEGGSDTATVAFPYGAGVVYVTAEGGVFFSEVDSRSSAVVAQLYPGHDLDARVIDSELIVKDGDTLYQIDL